MAEVSGEAVVPAGEKKTPEEKSAEKDGAVREAAHAVADVEANATIELAKVEEEARKIGDIAGAKAAEKWLESKSKEIEAKAQAALDDLKKTFEERFAAIEGKLKAPESKPVGGTESGQNAKPDNSVNEKPDAAASVVPSESRRRKVRRI